MAAPAMPRSTFLVLFTGVTLLVAVYFAARAGEWEPSRRFTLGAAFLVVAAAVYLADWYVHRGARQQPPPR